MANPEHLKILKQGVKAWNEWRRVNKRKRIQPDLKGAEMSDVDLHKADLNNTNLSRANLSGVDLGGDHLIMANLSGANLEGAYLLGANLCRANLSGANLKRADLSEAMLNDANLRDANLNSANLNYVDLLSADLGGADLGRVNMVSGKLMFANLVGTNLMKACMRVSVLVGAKMQKANLRNADLRYCNLVCTDLAGSILSGAKLYGTSRDDWVIKDIECKYVYWDEDGKNRSPKDRDLKPGEFERLYAALPTIEYVFENGMSPIDPLIMDRVVQAIREREPEFDIKIDSINARGLAPSIKFTVQHEEYKERALEAVQKGYDERIKRLEAEKDRLYDLLGQAIDKDSIKLISAGPGAIVATDGSTINIQQHIHNALELQKVIADEPEASKSFAKVAKKTALDIVGGAIRDVAKGQVKEAAKQIIELGKDLGPILAKTAAYAFFKSIGA